MLGYIYKLTLTEDLDSFKKGEIYIGKHDGKKPEYFGSGKIIKAIRKKYSTQVFTREILAKDMSKELLCYLEIYYINLYQCNRLLYKKGLNLTNGGEGTSGYIMTEEQKKKITEAINKTYNEGRKGPKAKQVHQYSLQTGDYIQSFNKCFEAAKTVGMSPSAIAYCARGINFSVGGFIWSYEKKDKVNIDVPNMKKVLQYDLEGNFIREFPSIANAAKALNTQRSSIGNCCRGESKSSMNFIWKFKNNENEISS